MSKSVDTLTNSQVKPPTKFAGLSTMFTLQGKSNLLLRFVKIFDKDVIKHVDPDARIKVNGKWALAGRQAGGITSGAGLVMLDSDVIQLPPGCQQH